MNRADAQGKNVSGRGGSKCKGPVAQNRAWKPVQLEQNDQQEGQAATRSERQGGGAAGAACWGSGCCYPKGHRG